MIKEMTIYYKKIKKKNKNKNEKKKATSGVIKKSKKILIFWKTIKYTSPGSTTPRCMHKNI